MQFVKLTQFNNALNLGVTTNFILKGYNDIPIFRALFFIPDSDEQPCKINYQKNYIFSPLFRASCKNNFKKSGCEVDSEDGTPHWE